MSATTNAWLAAREITRAQLEDQPDVTVATDVAYERLRPVDRLHAPDFHPGHFYFAGDDLRMVYLPQEGLPAKSADEVTQALGPPEEQLRSRAGKTSIQDVWPGLGFAMSHDGDQIDFVEVFPPTTADRYAAEIYDDPGPFYR